MASQPRGEQFRQGSEQPLVDRGQVVLAFESRTNDPGLAQDLQMMRNRGLRDMETLDDLSARQLARCRDLLDDPEPIRIGKRLQCPNHVPIVHCWPDQSPTSIGALKCRQALVFSEGAASVHPPPVRPDFGGVAAGSGTRKRLACRALGVRGVDPVRELGSTRSDDEGAAALLGELFVPRVLALVLAARDGLDEFLAELFGERVIRPRAGQKRITVR